LDAKEFGGSYAICNVAIGVMKEESNAELSSIFILQRSKKIFLEFANPSSFKFRTNLDLWLY
jgi:hypothetical protein